MGMALQVRFEEVDEDDVELFLLYRKELSKEHILALEELHIREESESSPEGIVPVKPSRQRSWLKFSNWSMKPWPSSMNMIPTV